MLNRADELGHTGRCITSGARASTTTTIVCDTDEFTSTRVGCPPGRSQGQTAGRVLVDVETKRASEKLVNQRWGSVAVSRGQYDARIYTDDKVKLARALDRDVPHRSVLGNDARATIATKRGPRDFQE